jgi:hypothetical protein
VGRLRFFVLESLVACNPADGEGVVAESWRLATPPMMAGAGPQNAAFSVVGHDLRAPLTARPIQASRTPREPAAQHAHVHLAAARADTPGACSAHGR